jgi:hypothetical protein
MHWRCAAAFLAILLAAAGARAEEPGCIGKRQAKGYFELGQGHLKLGDYESAISDFEMGYRCAALPLFLFDIAEAARVSGQTAKALDYYHRFLITKPTARDRAYVQQQIALLKRHGGAQPPTGAHAQPAPPPIAEARPELTTPPGASVHAEPPPRADVTPPTEPSVHTEPPSPSPSLHEPSASVPASANEPGPSLLMTVPPPRQAPRHRGRWIAVGVVAGALVIGGAVTTAILLTRGDSGLPAGFHSLGVVTASGR